MTNPIPSASKLVRLRRDAKKLARQQGIPLHTAQECLAVAMGHTNWSLMIKAINGAANSAKGRAGAANLSSVRCAVQMMLSMASLEQFFRHTSVAMTLYYLEASAFATPNHPQSVALVRGETKQG